MACPDGPVELRRALADAAPTAAHAAEGPPPITSIGRQLERFTSIAVARPPVGRQSYAGNGLQRLGCPGRDRRRRFLARAGRNARAASIPRIQSGTTSAAGGSGSLRR